MNIIKHLKVMQGLKEHLNQFHGRADDEDKHIPVLLIVTPKK